MFSLVDSALDAEALKATLVDGGAGACVTFEGWVRNENEGHDVLRLEYEGYEAVAVKEGQRVLEEAIKKFSLIQADCQHRVGTLAIGEMAVWVGVSSGHRGEAFEACRYIIDEVKHRLPIWKKEYYANGDSGWVKCETCAASGSETHTH
jgi:molybdopterin synthase catalytic subunit